MTARLPHPTRWVAAPPLWAADPAGFDATALDTLQRPTLLRFTGDDFMQRLLDLLQHAPQRLDELIARPETWRGLQPETPAAAPKEALSRPAALLRRRTALDRAQGPSLPVPGNDPENPLKLFQPVHQRYYLVAASLVCDRPGMPDRGLQTGHDQVGFVIRRLFPAATSSADPATWIEHAFVKDEAGARWAAIGATPETTLVDGEDLLPLFPLAFSDRENRPRRLHGGLIPAGRRDEYVFTGRSPEALPVVAGATPPPHADPRYALLQAQVIEPWKALIAKAYGALAVAIAPPAGDPSPSDAQKRDAVAAADDQLVESSWYHLLDFRDWLQAHLPDVWQALDKTTAASGLSGAARTLHAKLEKAAFPAGQVGGFTQPAGAPTQLRAALAAIEAERSRLDAADAAYPQATAAGWPGFRFPLAWAVYDPPQGVFGPYRGWAASGAGQDIDTALGLVDGLAAAIADALAETAADTAVQAPFAAKLAASLSADYAAGGNATPWFAIRCVYRHPDCGPLNPPRLSAATRPFQLAGFFDSDAPVRPLRIALPVDTTPAGLRKFNKNTAFMISDVLCGQIKRARGLGLGDLIRSVLPWPLHQDLDLGDMAPCKDSGGNALGMICSLSLPIITLCALILLMVMVSLLDFVFRWIPYFIVCFPVPGLKGKK